MKDKPHKVHTSRWVRRSGLLAIWIGFLMDLVGLLVFDSVEKKNVSGSFKNHREWLSVGVACGFISTVILFYGFAVLSEVLKERGNRILARLVWGSIVAANSIWIFCYAIALTLLNANYDVVSEPVAGILYSMMQVGFQAMMIFEVTYGACILIGAGIFHSNSQDKRKSKFFYLSCFVYVLLMSIVTFSWDFAGFFALGISDGGLYFIIVSFFFFYVSVGLYMWQDPVYRDFGDFNM